MSIKSALEQLLDETQGAQGAIFADWEGEAVELASGGDDYHLKVIAAHQGIILGQLRQAVARLGKGGVENVMIRAAELDILVAPVDEDYFVVLTLEKSALPVRARQALRGCVARLRREL